MENRALRNSFQLCFCVKLKLKSKFFGLFRRVAFVHRSDSEFPTWQIFSNTVCRRQKSPTDGGAENLTLRLADGASAERDGRQWRRRTRLWCTSADVFGEKTLRLELYLVLLRLIGTLAAVNTVPPRGDGLRLRAAELMTALKRRRSIVFPCGLRFTQSGGRAEAKPQKGAFFCISPDSWMASFTRKKEKLLTIYKHLWQTPANPSLSLSLSTKSALGK